MSPHHREPVENPHIGMVRSAVNGLVRSRFWSFRCGRQFAVGTRLKPQNGKTVLSFLIHKAGLPQHDIEA